MKPSPNSLLIMHQNSMSDIEQKVLFHLTLILYPPVSKILLRPALTAISLAKLDRMGDLVLMPGKGCLSVKALIDGLHLHGFVHPVEMDGYLEPVHRHIQEETVHCCVRAKLKKTMSFLFLMVKNALARI